MNLDPFGHSAVARFYLGHAKTERDMQYYKDRIKVIEKAEIDFWERTHEMINAKKLERCV